MSATLVQVCLLQLVEVTYEQRDFIKCAANIDKIQIGILDSAHLMRLFLVRAKLALAYKNFGKATEECFQALNVIEQISNDGVSDFEAFVIELLAVISRSRSEPAAAAFFSRRLPKDYQFSIKLYNSENSRGKNILQHKKNFKVVGTAKLIAQRELVRFNLAMSNGKIIGKNEDKCKVAKYAVDENNFDLASFLFAGMFSLC